jgi:NAD(P)-dependent dehydrogenase (short-subunit alcohol dehydrogenase family)
MQALQRIGELADIGSVVAFLASDDACWITADTIRVDGGSKPVGLLLNAKTNG